MTKTTKKTMSDDALLGKVIDVRQCKADIDKLKKQKEAVEGEIKSELESRGIEEITVGLFKVTYRNYTRKVFDRQRFLEQWPDLYAQYTVEQTYMALNVA